MTRRKQPEEGARIERAPDLTVENVTDAVIMLRLHRAWVRWRKTHDPAKSGINCCAITTELFNALDLYAEMMTDAEEEAGL